VKEKVSVIIPVYNAQDHLHNTLSSVLKQDYKNIEVIAVNDGSKDGSLSILNKIASEDSRVSVVDKPNGGCGDARNAAFDKVTGDFIMFVDADDTMTEDAISLALSKIGENDMLIGNFNAVANDNASERGLIKQEQILTESEFLDIYVKSAGKFYFSALWNKLYRSDIILGNNIRFNTQLSWGEDFMFNCNYYKYIKSVKILPEPLYNHNLRFTGQTFATLHRLPSSIRIKKQLYMELKELYKYKRLYKQYRFYVTRYIFNVTVLD
jgi:glycosyltransferase involved in cell wall biosynthesis